MAQHVLLSGDNLSAVVNKCSPGDFVYLTEGIYGGTTIDVSGEPGKYISILAYPGHKRENIIVKGKLQFYFEAGVSYIKIDGFVMEGDGTLASNGIELAPGPNHYNIFSNMEIRKVGYAIDFGTKGSKGNLVENCFIHDNAGCGIHTSGETIGTIYRKNLIYNCAYHGFGQVSGKDEQILDNIVFNCNHGILYTGNPENCLIARNLCYNNNLWEIVVFGAGKNCTIINNTAHSKDNGGPTYWLEGSGHILKNNIGYRTDGKNWDQSVAIIPASAIADYNCWYNPNNPDPVSGKMGLHSILKDPKFVDILKRDYRLQSDSPCIKTGEGGVDMGYPYEIQPIPEPEEDKMWNVTGADFVATEKKGSISGKVTKDGVALEGIPVHLSGDVASQVTTDASGDFKFDNLPAGNYVVEPKEPSYTFNPVSIAITIPTA